MARVVLDGVTKTFSGNVVAVSDLSLTLWERELVVIVGPSGCGKSTTLRLIAGLEELTRGSIRFDGHPVHHWPPHHRNVAMVFQHYVLYPQMTVRGNLEFSLRWGQRRRRFSAQARRQRVQDAARRLGLDHLLGRMPRELSGGERQRVALGRAMLREPSVFLLDEPLRDLDPPLRRELGALIARLRFEVQSPILYVTHDQAEATALGDRIVVLDRGMVQQIGTGAELLERPANRFVAEFVGMPPMNILEGKLASRNDGVWFEAGPVCLPLPDPVALRCERFADQDVLIGVRPDAIRCRTAGERETGLPARVEYVERMCRGDYLTVAVGAQKLTCQANSATPSLCGTTVELYVDMTHCQVFDRVGKNLTQT